MAYDSTQHLRDYVAQLQAQIAELDALGHDPELMALATEERERLQAEISQTEDTIKGIENGKQTSVEYHNCTLELRPGAGGDESKIWMSDLLQMYSRYAMTKGFKVESLDETTIKLSGKHAYRTFRFESGVHRVQRVPATEAQGRIHTSTASVAVIPEIPERDIEIREDELDWQFYRAGGHGGQNVNKVSTAVRLTHVPTGMVVTASRERSQAQNRVQALELLRGLLWEKQEEERLARLGEARSAIGSGKRAEKIRTYNYPQNRLTDHRIPRSWHDLDRRLLGDLDDVIAALEAWERGEDNGDASSED